ncbi:MAG TPA: hypothetical protein VNF99_03920 [Stellaceae bacterium]|nr:hypothetical protein [Stellaceae bacterium]
MKAANFRNGLNGVEIAIPTHFMRRIYALRPELDGSSSVREAILVPEMTYRTTDRFSGTRDYFHYVHAFCFHSPENDCEFVSRTIMVCSI